MTRYDWPASDDAIENDNAQRRAGYNARIRFGYDELLRNRSDTYMTPYTGEGTNLYTLPSTWISPLGTRWRISPAKTGSCRV